MAAAGPDGPAFFRISRRYFFHNGCICGILLDGILLELALSKEREISRSEKEKKGFY